VRAVASSSPVLYWLLLASPRLPIGTGRKSYRRLCSTHSLGAGRRLPARRTGLHRPQAQYHRVCPSLSGSDRTGGSCERGQCRQPTAHAGGRRSRVELGGAHRSTCTRPAAITPVFRSGPFPAAPGCTGRASACPACQGLS